MSKFTPTNKNNSCQICEDATGKCRSKEDNGKEFFLCMTLSDTKKGKVINGYKCIAECSPTKSYPAATFVLDNSQEWTEEQKDKWEQEKRRRQQEKAREDEARKSKSLSPEERDRGYREILAQLQLHPDDRADLERRGFSPEQIEKSGFKSVTKYQKLATPVNLLLPGVTDNGQKLLSSGDGCLIPVRDVNGYIVGCQIRLRNPEDGNRYRWLSGGNNVLPLFPSKESQGENPLAIFRREGSNMVTLVEGTGAKPFLTSERFKCNVIGASGGQFLSSPELLREALETLIQRDRWVGGPLISCVPDAGDILNPAKVNQWNSLFQKLEEWDICCVIYWWGQAAKEKPDIDENPEKVKEILVEDWFKLVEKYKGKREKLASKNTSAENKTKTKTEPIKPTEIKTKTESTKDTKPSTQPSNNSLNPYVEKAKNEWRKTRKFTAKHIIKNSQGWFKWPVPKENTITFIKSGLGSGKTTQVIEWVLSLIDELWRNPGYRNSLLLQFCAKTDKATEERFGKKDGFYHLHEHEAKVFISDSTGKISFCIHSFLHFKPEDFDGCNLLLDETVSVIRALFEDGNIKQHERVLNLFAEAVRRAKRVICLDGLMNDWVVKYISALAPDKEVVTVQNVDNRKKPIVNFLEGTLDLEAEKVKKNDRSPWLELIFEYSQKPAIGTDSQLMGEWLGEALSEKGYKVLRVDSKTVPEKYVKDFMSDCDGYLEREKPDVLIYTPSAESGLDVAIKGYFTHHITFFFGQLSVDSYIQMLGRIRDNIPKYVWCKEWVAKEESADSRSPFVSTLEKSLLSAMELDITECFSSETEDLKALVIPRLIQQIQEANNIHFKTFAQVKAIRNYERGNLRECMLEAIQEAGYPVQICTPQSNEELKARNKDGVKEIKKKNSHDIFVAEKIDINAIDYGSAFDATWEERCKKIQALYRKQLPGIELTDSWSEEFIYKIRYENPKFITHNRRYWLFKNPEVAYRVQQEQWNRIFHQEDLSLARVRSERALVDALRKIGLAEVIDSDRDWKEGDTVIKRIVEACKKPQIANALGYHPGKATPIKVIGHLLKMLGLGFKGSQQRVDGDRIRTYRVVGLDDPDRLNAQACLVQKYAKYLANEVEVLKWAEIPTQQGLEGVTDELQNYNNIGAMCDTQNKEKASDEVGDLVGDLVGALTTLSTYEDFVAVAATCLDVEEAITTLPAPSRQRCQEWAERRDSALMDWLGRQFTVCPCVNEFWNCIAESGLALEKIAAVLRATANQSLSTWWNESMGNVDTNLLVSV